MCPFKCSILNMSISRVEQTNHLTYVFIWTDLLVKVIDSKIVEMSQMSGFAGFVRTGRSVPAKKVPDLFGLLFTPNMTGYNFIYQVCDSNNLLEVRFSLLYLKLTITGYVLIYQDFDGDLFEVRFSLLYVISHQSP